MHQYSSILVFALVPTTLPEMVVLVEKEAHGVDRVDIRLFAIKMK